MIVGPSSLLGKEVKNKLAIVGYPSDSVRLLDLEDVAGLITEYGEEARVVAEVAHEELFGSDLVCFCGDPDIVRQYLPRLIERGGLGLDCTGAWVSEDDTVLSLPAAGRAPTPQPGTAVALPSAATQLLGTTLATLESSADAAVATVLLPASDAGDAGLKELAQQSIAMLNLSEEPQPVFGRRLAFDLWPAAPSAGVPALESVRAELQRLRLPVPALTLLQAPVFHSVSASLWLPGIELEEILDTLGEAGISSPVPGEAGAIDSPARAAGQPGLQVGAAWSEGDRGSWLWLLMDNLESRAAAAVETIVALVGTP